MRCALVSFAALAACGGPAPAPDAAVPEDVAIPDDRPRPDAGIPPMGVAERARELSRFLRGPDAHFLVGMGNDLDGAPTYDPDRAGVYTLGTELDVHYAYLVGYSDVGGWVTWNAGGTFPRIHAEAAQRNGGVAMMFTYYQLALDYETGADTLPDASRMLVWLSDVRVLLQRLGEHGRPAMVQFEPDLFGYLQNRMRDMSTTPDAYAMRIRFTEIPECMALPEVASSLGPCLDAMRDALAPNVRIAFHASQWGDYYDFLDPSADVEGAGRSVGAFLAAMGAGSTDFVTVEALDRDAGFWETNGGMAGMCSVTMGPRGAVYWDETNATLPNFAQHLRWVRALTTELGLPALWWQLPFGVPNDTCGGPGGGSDGDWRDNRVRYFFSHVDELVAAGGFGAVWGTGAGRQTYITTDGGQFQRAVQAYFASPTPL
jgi:hypothetical protein